MIGRARLPRRRPTAALEWHHPARTLDFVFEGTALRVEPGCGDGSPCDGNLQITVDDDEPVTLAGTSGAATIVRGLQNGKHSAQIQVTGGRSGVSAITVRREAPAWLRWTALAAAALALLLLIITQVAHQVRVRRPSEAPPPAGPPAPSDEPTPYPRRRLWRGIKQ